MIGRQERPAGVDEADLAPPLYVQRPAAGGAHEPQVGGGVVEGGVHGRHALDAEPEGRRGCDSRVQAGPVEDEACALGDVEDDEGEGEGADRGAVELDELCGRAGGVRRSGWKRVRAVLCCQYDQATSMLPTAYAIM